MTKTPISGDAEKGDAGLTIVKPSVKQEPRRQPKGLPHQDKHHPHLDQARERLRHFWHPDGRKIHVAHSPEEAISLKRQLDEIHSQEEFDIFVSGSKEHLDALRGAQTHNERQREALRSEFPELFDRFAAVHADLDALSHELERVTTHGVSLEAHFSKYGYDAHIRSYDDDEKHSTSGTTSLRSGNTSISEKQSKVERGYASPLKLWKAPVLRQYWHDGILWRASAFQEVQSFELFTDLLYVGILAITGDTAAEDPTGYSLLQFVITFTLAWKIWSELELTVSWFETDDVAQRISILFQLAVLLGLTTNITHGLDGTYATLIGFYLSARLCVMFYFIIVGIYIPMIRGIILSMAASILISAGLWIASIHVAYPAQLALIFLGLTVDLCWRMLYMFKFVNLSFVSTSAKAWFDTVFEVMPAINIEHRTERMNSFVTLVFGYMVVSLLYQTTTNGIDAHYGKAVLGLVQAFCFNWLYFEVDGSHLHMHAIRRSKYSTFVWNGAHLPFIMGIVLAAGAQARLVLSTDVPGTSADGLAGVYHERSEEHVSDGIRWFYCVGLGVALACMGLISLSHEHLTIEGLRLNKKWRLTGRFSVALIFVCLPLATGLNSLELVGVVTSLVVFVLGLELWAVSCEKDTLCSGGTPRKYFGRCKKRDLEKLIREGHEEVDVVDLLRKGNGGEKASGTVY